MSVLLRLVRMVSVVAAATAVLTLGGFGAPRAAAAPETTVREGGRQAEALELAMQMRERQQKLAELYRRADARDRALLGRKAFLAKYGYTGDPEEVRVVLPLASYHLSAGFGLTGPLWEAEHGGQDFGAATGEPIVAVSAGLVNDVAYAGPYGLRTILTLDDGTEVWFCHQTDVSVYVGQQVEVADQIGTVGSSGNSTGPHLHLEVRPGGGGPVDPLDWLRAAGLAP
jgi:murein DD-endopeptidase MepM/ murein hydrolase activator NlpD